MQRKAEEEQLTAALEEVKRAQQAESSAEVVAV